ncbi:hypothetical protein GTZ99_02995 [Novosphingobium sp. FSY-8]|uniref:Uncharacterized protein n=1 Tax=Novosphingobium ovatum TaxID=1908523 RepID=A0ABW9XAG2_9SPHN|nr:hypothetical protein [Novosphingobium ovatum]NBC35518.1 hypothetical protein [Novosphingobium ovatum]
MAKGQSRAEHLREHRAVFELAMQLGCSLDTAAQELARRRAWARLNASTARLRAKMAGAPTTTSQPTPPPAKPAPWWVEL